jgi:hypothetical protein
MLAVTRREVLPRTAISVLAFHPAAGLLAGVRRPREERRPEGLTPHKSAVAYGWSPEEIHFQHPYLSLAQIHGALTYYYENQGCLDAQIRRGSEESAKLASQISDADLRRKLSDLKEPL